LVDTSISLFVADLGLLTVTCHCHAVMAKEVEVRHRTYHYRHCLRDSHAAV